VDSLCRIGRVSRFRTPLSPLRQKFRDADEVVADQIEQEAGGDSSEPPVFRLDLPPINQAGSGVKLSTGERRGHGTETVYGGRDHWAIADHRD
jgi:hypothetical protein